MADSNRCHHYDEATSDGCVEETSDRHVTAEQRSIANAALNAGSYGNDDQLINAVAAALNLKPIKVESVLELLRIRQVLDYVTTSRNVNGSRVSVRYERGVDWKEE